LRDLQRTRNQLLAEVATFEHFRPGTLVERYRKCGKASCHCANDDRHAHGPCWSLTFPVEGKTVTRVIPAGPAVDRTQKQIAEYRRFREWVARFTEVNLQVCDEDLAQAEVASDDAGAAKKGASRRNSSRKSSGRSTS
jgi:hypothetical protein